MNKLVSYSVAKLLKSKGFNEPCRFVHDNWNNIIDWIENGEGEHRNSQKNSSIYYSAPTIAEVVMWLYEKHNIWINVYYNNSFKKWNYNYNNINWSKEEIDKKFKKDTDEILNNIFNTGLMFNTLLEAYESAIEDCLNNLIE